MGCRGWKSARDAAASPPHFASWCSTGSGASREEVQAAFWPDAEPERAQERLRRTLYLLRRAIEPHTDLIAAEGVELAVAPDASLWVDYEAFEAALLDAHRTDQPNREPLERAVALYRDDLLKDIMPTGHCWSENTPASAS